jgi:circadian clock protein KaiB
LSKIFKGIALFTPGGDLIYCIDPSKQGRWHFHLCVAWQKILNLPSPPHFLVPGYTATVDNCFDPHSERIKVFTQIYPGVKRYQPLLNAIFDTKDLVWQIAPWQEEFCSPIILENYRHQFPQLWEKHDLLISLEDINRFFPNLSLEETNTNSGSDNQFVKDGYSLILFVSGNNSATEKTLFSIHQLLEQRLGHPYTLKIIDISKNPEEAELNHISATPTLLRMWPQPVRRIVGELEDVQRIVKILVSH